MQPGRAGGQLSHPRCAAPFVTRASVAEFRRQTLAPDDEQELMATLLLLDDCGRQECCHGRVAAPGRDVRNAESPALQGFPMRRRDSSLHPVSLDQALNLVTRPPYPSESPQIVRIVPKRGRYGRIGRSGCCHGRAAHTIRDDCPAVATRAKPRGGLARQRHGVARRIRPPDGAGRRVSSSASAGSDPHGDRPGGRILGVGVRVRADRAVGKPAEVRGAFAVRP